VADILTLVDTNVLLDVVTNAPDWADWSIGQLDAAAMRGRVAICDIVYAEISVRFRSIETLDTALEAAGIELLGLSREALFLAGKAFLAYRAAGGARTGVLPDLFIGAHAVTLDAPLLARDTGRFRAYFPSLTLITPAPIQ